MLFYHGISSILTTSQYSARFEEIYSTTKLQMLLLLQLLSISIRKKQSNYYLLTFEKTVKSLVYYTLPNQKLRLYFIR